ncbi:protein CASC2, isoforms 1/2 isoform X2 [Gorilla gorilla gorilla]|uniref:Protein CASC2, isoforms 1/2 n=1 Tax=Homo sapiens TaxID=9606 RepID=CASC2_HUMAN|nr:protein CASC2, isoforms 1/2 isoform X2 [Gorilla gorilla gorilla]XP_004050217.1 protein CASC2, isoforms 1/2 isoform X2 [Gorilla gorilla gorilla]XP_055207965.1 protein CASC2, isoforms 1/2 isoform X2 [Gorilla gorilla gorilla]Q8IU53.1 RecName: Full=Protein CASC2, isoforms 1/2; AltName: Full=Cancer susceptibility candidate gene 2 protein isoforms 1/2 [Homo sapiens]EAW49421.1 cancer susceptibility candidate 2, isoform CRA_c [Homo sapiens]CAC83044.1 IGM1 protein [Homo sapiens]CAD59606.1 hypotheti
MAGTRGLMLLGPGPVAGPRDVGTCRGRQMEIQKHKDNKKLPQGIIIVFRLQTHTTPQIYTQLKGKLRKFFKEPYSE